MLFKSKMIYDPNQRSFGRHGNKMGLTIGLTVHTPKFHDCHKHDYYTSQWDERSRPLSEETKERRYQAHRRHRHCKPGQKRGHVNYVGYAYWTGPKRRYTFRYMGPNHERYAWWKPFSISEHGRYTRWLDNGPQSPTPPTTDADLERFRPAMDAHMAEFRLNMADARRQMEEYAARRDRELDG